MAYFDFRDFEHALSRLSSGSVLKKIKIDGNAMAKMLPQFLLTTRMTILEWSKKRPDFLLSLRQDFRLGFKTVRHRTISEEAHQGSHAR